MGDTAETYRAMKQLEKQRNAARRDVAAAAFPSIRQHAAEHDLRLTRHTEAHYQLAPVDRSWILDIYPGKRRLYSDRKKVAPHLSVPEDWTLMDVVEAAIAIEAERFWQSLKQTDDLPKSNDDWTQVKKKGPNV